MKSDIPGVVINPLQRHADERGYFVEVSRTSELGVGFSQANHSHSRAGVLRGLHYHRNQDDLWYVVAGEAQVVLVDLRRPDDAAVEHFTISDGDPATVFIPRGVAHGFLAVTDVDLVYWVTQEYNATDEYGIAWNDPSLAIPWAIQDPVLSPRDAENEELDWDVIPRFS